MRGRTFWTRSEKSSGDERSDASKDSWPLQDGREHHTGWRKEGGEARVKDA